ncbi:metallophosphoesterase family protein [Veillonella caviae]|uniref:metallophosphoesterase family protein n=2 Tax=Veillonella caviae TaxID=248316 RepID=UPI0023F3835E|nr:exonuclease SbcCD subunit D [Veillonella caviae]MCI6407256.1 exonuclease SbcCD subunit D [Veillonella caviae]
MMQPFRFIHCGDLHLGAPFQYVMGMSRTVDRTVAESTYVAFQRIVDMAVRERVQAFIISGDVYNSEDHNLEAQVRFVRAMYQLQEARIPVYMVQGNHDPAESWRAQLDMPSNVHVFTHAQVQRFPLMVNNIEIGGVYGISCGHGNEHTNFAVQYKAFERDEFSIAVMHGTVGSSQDADVHNVTGPCNVSDMIQGAMDYWALGHIHKSQVLGNDPMIVYAGNPQGLHRKECGSKGCYMVKVSHNGHCELEFVETSAIRFEEIKLDITGIQKESELLEVLSIKKNILRKQYKKPILLSVQLIGTGSMHALAMDEGVRNLWLKSLQDEEKSKSVFVMPYKIIDKTRPSVNLGERRLLSDMVGDYLRAYDSAITDVSTVRQILLDRPEAKRLGAYADLLTDELLLRVMERSEMEGVTVLMGAHDEH